MKKLIAIILSIVTLVSLASCSGGGKNDENKVIIYASTEEFRNEFILKTLTEKFPDYNITLQYQPTGTSAAKMKAEGTKIEADIILALDTAYMNDSQDILADLSEFDSSAYLDELLPEHKKFLPWERFSGSIVINDELLRERGLDVPTSYEDLLDPQYKGQISMPNPKASGTGYFFLQYLITAHGEDATFEYFDKLTENILQYTSSGSGPINALVQGEVPIALGMTFQAVSEINKGVGLSVNYFEEGAPFSTTAFGIIDGRQDKKAVQDVFEFLANELVYIDKDLFSPEKIFKEQVIEIENYPQNIPYASMEGLYDIEEKERILNKWEH